ncbi:MAG: hypothetical protein PVF43_03080 [Candidatus Eiseniibacteriota bacterium]|jgi:hypothetical protein
MRKFFVLAIASLSLMAWSVMAVAGPHCSAQAKASCQKAGVTCAAKGQKTAAMLEGLDVATTRLPSGAMLVMYSSDDAETVKTLQASVAKGTSDFDCRLCQKIAGDQNCTIEIAAIDNGVIALVTADDPKTVDAYEMQFAAMYTPETSNN